VDKADDIKADAQAFSYAGKRRVVLRTNIAVAVARLHAQGGLWQPID